MRNGFELFSRNRLKVLFVQNKVHFCFYLQNCAMARFRVFQRLRAFKQANQFFSLRAIANARNRPQGRLNVVSSDLLIPYARFARRRRCRIGIDFNRRKVNRPRNATRTHQHIPLPL